MSMSSSPCVVEFIVHDAECRGGNHVFRLSAPEEAPLSLDTLSALFLSVSGHTDRHGENRGLTFAWREGEGEGEGDDILKDIHSDHELCEAVQRQREPNDASPVLRFFVSFKGERDLKGGLGKNWQVGQGEKRRKHTRSCRDRSGK